MDGTLSALDNNTVDDPELKWWRVENVLGQVMFEVLDVSDSDCEEVVESFNLDGSDVDIWLYDFYVEGEQYQTRLNRIPQVDDVLYIFNTDREEVANDFESYYIENTGDGWVAAEVQGDMESVPEPSLIIGSVLALAAGTKVLKRGNQKYKPKGKPTKVRKEIVRTVTAKFNSTRWLTPPRTQRNQLPTYLSMRPSVAPC